MAMPSSSRCGSLSPTARSMNAPGSPSSALQIRYFCVLVVARASLHFLPVGNLPHLHHRRRVDLVGVADQVLLRAGGPPGELPFLAGRESAAPAPAQAALLDQ